jgi:uncharacterized protein (TIGR02271 family)
LEKVMTTRTITAIYDSESDARAARQQLLQSGLEDDDVRIVSHQLTSTAVGGDAQKHEGLWESIKDFFVGDDDRPVYSEGLRRGGCLLTARVPDERSDEAISLLEATNAVDLDQRADQWRNEGWSETDAAYIGDEQLSYGESAAARSSAADRTEQAIPVVEERLRVGKREVDRGGVRVRSYIVEEPVEQDVSLHEERVEIERRPAQGAAADNMFREQTLDITERGEEPVVAKDAVVTGEVVVRKTADERTETVRDTVRRTEVDVDDTRKPAGTSKPRNKRST